MNKIKHELEQNELATALNRHVEKLKPHAFLISVIVLGICAAILLIGWRINTSRAIQASRWEQLMIISDAPQATPQDLMDVASDNSGTTAGALARLQSSWLDVINAFQRDIRENSDSKTALKRARQNYQEVVDSTTELPAFIRERALLGLADVNEALGDFASAEKYYQTILEQAPDSPLASYARQGVERVNDPRHQGLVSAYEAWTPDDFTQGQTPNEGGLPPRPRIEFPPKNEPPAVPPGNSNPTSDAADAATELDDDAPLPPILQGDSDKDDGPDSSPDPKDNSTESPADDGPADDGPADDDPAGDDLAGDDPAGDAADDPAVDPVDQTTDNEAQSDEAHAPDEPNSEDYWQADSENQAGYR